MEIYLDNSATTKCFDSVAELMMKVMTEDYGNASSMHIKGVDAEKYYKNATEIIAKTLHAQPKEIFFTSGGTESNNIALIGAARANKRAGMHIISTVIEHPSVTNTLKYLESEGFEITFLNVDKNGLINIEELKSAIRPDTIIVSVMMVNNEIGSLQDFEKIGAVIKETNPNCLFHVDAVQGYGKVKINVNTAKIDMLTASGHKIHGPKGIGFLYVRNKTKLTPICYGGGQQNNMRSGTINTPGIAGMGKAAEEIYKDFDSKQSKLYEVKDYFINSLNEIDGCVVNTSPDNSITACHVVNASFPGIRSEVMLHSLEDRDIYVSSGSACSTHDKSGSKKGVLQYIGADKSLSDSAIRFSMNMETSKDDVDQVIKVLKELIPFLGRYTRR